MNRPEIVLLAAVLIVIIIVIVIVAYDVLSPGGGTSNTKDMFQELFAIKINGSNMLGSGTLISGYRYALASEIQEALRDGMRIPGISAGWYALYSSPAPLHNNEFPNVYICKTGDFDENIDISFTPQGDKGTDDANTFIAFVIGYKPIDSSFQVMLNGASGQGWYNPNVSSQSVLAWNTNQWNSEYSSDSIPLNGEEPFIAVFTVDLPFITNLPESWLEPLLQQLGPFNIATNDQIYWATANDFGKGYKDCYTHVYSEDNAYPFWQSSQKISSPVPIQECLNFNVPFNSGCSEMTKSCFNVLVWGVKKLFPTSIKKGLFEIPNTMTVLPFNSSKSSFYD